MIVDDDEDGRLLVEHRLRKVLTDCAVVACGSLEEALRLLARAKVDAIITDNHLGLESGADLIRQARGGGITCPIVMVTGSDDPQVQRNAYAAGATKVFAGGQGDSAEFLQRVLGPATPPQSNEDPGWR
jgi:CheY-like chemotaxis protein